MTYQMKTPVSGPQIDGQWIDYYALLDVPINAEEDAIRRRIGKVYADAAANGEHRDSAKRHYYQALLERVLPQCRRVLLDSEWRARYDHQHLLHRENDGAAQDYVEFISSMRTQGGAEMNQALLPQRAQDEISVARQVIEAALSGAELELLPSQTLSQNALQNGLPEGAPSVPAHSPAAPAIVQSAPNAEFASAPAIAPAPAIASSENFASIPQMQAEPDEELQSAAPRGKKRRNLGATNPAPQQTRSAPPKPLEIVAQVQPFVAPSPASNASKPTSAPVEVKAVSAQAVGSAPVSGEETAHRQPGEPARATVITAQEAADIRRRRASNPNIEPFVGPSSRDVSPKSRPRSRVMVEVADPNLRRKLSPTSLNLVVAITGVLLTITIQRFASTPAIATNAGRTPIVLAVAPEMQTALEGAAATWEKTPEGAGYDVVVQSLDSSAAMQRALSKGGEQIDGWIPASASFVQRYNQLAPDAKRPALQIGDSLAQTPMVLVARADKAAVLRAAFPDHKIGTWAALRAAVARGAGGRFGLSDPRQSLPGFVTRYSMAREWGAGQNKSPDAALKSAAFWKWMAAFEENIPSGAVSPDAMVKDMVLGTTGRYSWAVGYESDALNWMAQGKPLELFYLPRTALADHPFCAVERVGAPVEVAAGRAAFAAYLKSEGAQKALLQSGFRPTEISPATVTAKNPFTGARARGVQLQGLPRDERFNLGAMGALQKQWSQFYG